MTTSNRWMGTTLFSLSLNSLILFSFFEGVQPSSSLLLPPPSDKVTLKFISKMPPFVDAPREDQVDNSKAEFVSDKNSKMKSSDTSNLEGVTPKFEHEGIDIQTRRSASQMSASEAKKLIMNRKIQDEKIRERKALEGKTSLTIKEAVELKESQDEKKEVSEKGELSDLKGLDVELSETKVGAEGGLDILSLPSIGIGDFSKDFDPFSSLETKATGFGIYVKEMRDKIGLLFNQMVLFHYKTNYPFGSEALVSFCVDSSGFLSDLDASHVKGEPMFSEYCKTIIRNAAPFSPMGDEMVPYLEEGKLRVRFRFGYGLSDK